MDQDDLTRVINAMNDYDINRIAQRLDSVTHACRPENVENNAGCNDQTARQSIVDALSCEAFLSDPTRVRQHFQVPFDYYRELPVLRVEYLLPGCTTFLFDPDPARMHWASTTWAGSSSTLTEDEFDFAVRGPLARVLNQWSFIIADTTVIERLWRGLRVILERLDSNLVTHSLRAMEVQKDVFMLFLEHVTYDSPGLKYLLQTLKRFLELAPKDFWESMGAISPHLIIENIFNNREFVRLLHISGETTDSHVLTDLLDWIRPFVASLETVHQSQACRTLTSYLLDRLQAENLPSDARIACFVTGLKVIKWTSLNCNKEHPRLSQVGRVVAAELLEVSSTYIQRILAIPALPSEDSWHEKCSKQCFEVVELALTLECKCLRTDQEALRDKEDVGPGTCSYAVAMWESIVQQLDQRNIPLARAALSGINGLTGLEKFEIKKDVIHKKYKSDFNVRLGHFTHLVCLMLERINDFDPTDLDQLFHHPTTATALVASLFSPDASTYEAGVNLMKSISLESGRKEAIRHLLTPYFEVTLDSLSRSLRRIAQTRSYASCPRMLKTCSDVLDILCDSRTGLLRTKSLQSRQEKKALENFWEHQWTILTVIYQMTESWSRAQAADSEVMKEFVRDTMDLSERVFDQYSIFASAIDSDVIIKDENGLEDASKESAAKKLLAPPAKTMEVIVKWLRLRDTYLVGMSVKLTKKLLDRLTGTGMRLAKGPSDYVELVVQGGPQGKTNLSPQEKAELARALEANLGRVIELAQADNERSATPETRIARTSTLTKVVKREAKNGVIDIDLWRSKSKQNPKTIEVSDDDSFEDSGGLDEDILALSRTVEMTKKLGIGMSSQRHHDKQVQPKAPFISNYKALEARKTEDKRLADSKAFSEKRKKDIEAKRRRDAEQAALLKKNAVGKSLDSNSRLGNLGVQGKEHGPKGSSVMISTDSESDSEDEVDQTLFGEATKTPKIAAAVKEYQNNRMKQPKVPGPVKKMRKNRSAKDMRARLAPDLTTLHKTILGWEFFHDGDFPPRSDRDDYSLVSSTFRTPSDYQTTFEPLLILEAWQGFLKSKEEGSYKCFDFQVANRLTVDSFVEVSSAMSIPEGKELGISEADIILISKAQSPTTEPHQPHCLARVYKINRKKASMDISYRVNVDNGLLTAMVPNATLHGIKILSLTPQEREYGALLGLKYMDLCEEIIKARPSPLLDYSEKQLTSLVSQYGVNTAQAKAIKSAIDNDAFTLIQG